jgi:hypothetical protein
MKHFAKLLEQPGSRKGIDALVNVPRLSTGIYENKTISPSLEKALADLETQLFNSEALKKAPHNAFINVTAQTKTLLHSSKTA